MCRVTEVQRQHRTGMFLEISQKSTSISASSAPYTLCTLLDPPTLERCYPVEMMWNTYSNTHALAASVMGALIPLTYLRNDTASNLTSPPTLLSITCPWQRSEGGQCQSSTTYMLLLRFAHKMSDYSVSLDSISCNVTQLMLPCLYRLDRRHDSRVHRLPRNNLFTNCKVHMPENCWVTTGTNLPHYISQVATNCEISNPVLCTKYV